jgi:protein MpaA
VHGAPIEVRVAGDRKAPMRVLVVGSIHGDETAGHAVIRRLRAMGAPGGMRIWTVRTVNPDGVAAGTRGNARGVDLNRNFPTRDWRPDPVAHRSTLDDPRDVLLTPGAHAGSEPETQALMSLIRELRPEAVIALHAPLGCIDDPHASAIGRWLAERTGLPLVADVGYPTPGSFGTWGAEQGIPVVTYEFALSTMDEVVRTHVPVLVELLTSTDR